MEEASPGRLAPAAAFRHHRAMQYRFFPFVLLALVATLSACATTPRQAFAPTSIAWPLPKSDVPVDPSYRLGQLPNGMRYALRANQTPKGTAIVRLEIAAGSLDEADGELGFAHFVEHMAFNGSTRVPEGEMVKLLERRGLAFGADTNAETSFDRTTYRLDLPRSDPALLDTALMLMRETAGELTFSPSAVERERGIILAERRDRNTYALRNALDSAQFAFPNARFAKRFPIGSEETIRGASAEALRSFWRHNYVPSKATLIVIGDFDADTVEADIRQRFSTWAAAPNVPQPLAGPVKTADAARSDVFTDQALSERVIASRNGKWRRLPDSIATRQESLLRSIGYGIINRRLLRLSRLEKPPFRAAGFGTGPVFKVGRTTNLVVDSSDGKWREGLIAATTEYRRAFRYGFSQAEVAEQIEQARNAAQNVAASAETRSHSTLANAVFALIRDDIVPVTPISSLARLNEFVPQITPDKVFKALKRDAVLLRAPLLRWHGRSAPSAGEAALRIAWNEAMKAPLSRPVEVATTAFAYTDFGAPGTVAADTRDAALGIRTVRFANGVRLNLKHTDLAKDRINVQVRVDGGAMLDTKANPLASNMTSMLSFGGLGKHTTDELDSLLAGRTVSFNLGSSAEMFTSGGETTRRDLELQLQLAAALISDAGFRPEAETRYRLNINNFFASKDSTPASALSSQLGGVLSDYDPRFTLQKVEAYRALTIEKLRRDIADRLAKGAIEIGLTGDLDEDEAIRLTARTFGALPVREPEFLPYAEQRSRTFTRAAGRRLIRHKGPADQALLQFIWPTRDDSDAEETDGLELLGRLAQLALTEKLREELGQAYSPGAYSSASSIWKDYGTFTVSAQLALKEVPAARAAMLKAMATLRDRPVSDDMLLRARQPLIERFDNALKSNSGWSALVAQAQSKPERNVRFLAMRERLVRITAAQLQTLAARYLAEANAVEVLVLPEGADAPN